MSAVTGEPWIYKSTQTVSYAERVTGDEPCAADAGMTAAVAIHSHSTLPLGTLEKRLLDEYQNHFPLTHSPYADIARELGVSEPEVLACLQQLLTADVISRIGPVFQPKRLGASTLAAMAVPPPRLAAVARIINSYSEVNHNYERDHHFNLWFVIVAHNAARLTQIIAEIRASTGLAVLDLPMEQPYHIDLGFALWS
jgi:DNA-binding Lrp family transcriptional regulator